MKSAIWDYLFDNGLMPHGYCLLWDPWLFWSHAISDTVIAISYFSIPVVLITFAAKRTDFQYGWVLRLCGAFIICCGVTHLFNIWTLWVPSYQIESVLKVITALVSAATAVLLWPLLPKVLAIPSTSDLEASNARLEEEVQRRVATQEDLAELNRELESRVLQRTADLEIKNRELADATAKATVAAEAKSRFLATMSHEIRTPLHGVVSMSDLLMECDMPREQKDYASTIARSARALLAIVDDILDFFKLEAGRLRIQPQPTEVVSLCEEVVAGLAPLAHSRGLDVACRAVADVPQRVSVDPLRLRQILLNLVSNAIRYTDVGGVEITISTGGTSNAPRLILEVADTGIGISEERLEEVFERFNQVQEEVGTRGGSGLGLGISRRLSQLMGGSLTVRSIVGEGSTFTVELPLKDPIMAIPEAPISRRVAVVGADGPTKRSLESTLESLGVAVVPEDAEVVLVVGSPLCDFDTVAAQPTDEHRQWIFLTPIGFRSPSQSTDLPDPWVEARYPLGRQALRELITSDPAENGEKLLRKVEQPDGVTFGSTVLVVDDNQENLLVASRILERAGHEALIAGSAAEALQMLDQHCVDLVLMDLRMPEMDGFAAARAIRSRSDENADVPIIAVSANVMPSLAGEIERAEMTGHLAKPFRPSQLRALVDRYGAPPGSRGLEHYPILDKEALRELAEATSTGILEDTVRTFLDHLQDRINRLVEAQSIEDTAEAAHKLAGSAGVVFLMRVNRLCRQIELEALQGNLQGARSYRPKLLAAVEQGRDALADFVNLVKVQAPLPEPDLGR